MMEQRPGYFYDALTTRWPPLSSITLQCFQEGWSELFQEGANLRHGTAELYTSNDERLSLAMRGTTPGSCQPKFTHHGCNIPGSCHRMSHSQHYGWWRHRVLYRDLIMALLKSLYGIHVLQCSSHSLAARGLQQFRFVLFETALVAF